ncbi:MAG TPA: hypothetical protein VFN94_10220 [Nitrospiria bacterium]|nr:hypothetical protein [Nitrospiria bacterium]
MRNVIRGVGLAVVVIGIASAAMGDEGHTMGKVKNGIDGMSQDALIKLSLSAAPPHIAKDAGVMIPGADGKMMEVKKGSNGFTCIPTVNGRETPDPMCMDAAVGQWVDSLINKAPKPSNTVPGISYMGRGGYHWEKDGAMLMEEEPGAKLVKEPPHWMLMWPFDAKAAGLPTMPNRGGVYVMFDGTPYAHLMVEQDPAKIKP